MADGYTDKKLDAMHTDAEERFLARLKEGNKAAYDVMKEKHKAVLRERVSNRHRTPEEACNIEPHTVVFHLS